MTLSRRDFLVVGGCALSGLAAGCGNPVDGTVQPMGSQVTLTFAQFPKLAQPGGGVVVDVPGHDPIAVVRTATDMAAALDAVCTHAGIASAARSSAVPLSCACASGASDGRGVR